MLTTCHPVESPYTHPEKASATMIRSRFLYAILVCTVLAGCASTYDAGGPRRPDGTLFESNAEYRAHHGLPPTEAGPAAVRSPSVPANLSPGSLAYLDFKNGFRDLKFGDPPTSDMILQEASGDTKYYARSNDDPTLGGAQLQRIIYGFYKNRFYWVLLETKGLVNSRAMLDVLRQAYGSGYQGNRFLQQFAWLGNRVQGLYTENSVASDARMALQSKSITAEKDADDKAKARKGVSGL